MKTAICIFRRIKRTGVATFAVNTVTFTDITAIIAKRVDRIIVSLHSIDAVSVHSDAPIVKVEKQ